MSSANGFDYSDRYYDEHFEYRHVTVPKQVAGRIPHTRLLKEHEWRALGVCQSSGWMHYAIHKPERHILLFKRPRDFGALPQHEKVKWERQALNYVAQRNNEMQLERRQEARRAQSLPRHILREANPTTVAMMAGNGDEQPPRISDLFF